MMCPSGLDFIVSFFACLYARLIPVPVPASGNVQRKSVSVRVDSVMGDARPCIALGTGDAFEALTKGPSWDKSIIPVRVDTCRASDASLFREHEVRGRDIALLQYTSGSTSSPKGVMLTHENVLANVRMIDGALLHELEPVRGAFWLPMYHDMGLIGGVLANVYRGGSTAFMSPVDFVRRPMTWLRAIAETRANIIGAPNFGYELTIQRTTEEQRAELDLSCVRVAFSGAERVRRHTFEDFAAAFAVSGFRREALCGCYGLAEATLMVSGGVGPELQTGGADCGPAETHVSCGPLVSGLEVLVVDPAQRARCEAGEEGEIWVRGPSVGVGYWQRQAESAETFAASLPGLAAGFLRTGDLGFIRHGQLFVTGRMKDLIIVDGQNHHPEDIEHTISAGLSELGAVACAVFSVHEQHAEEVVVAVEFETRSAKRARGTEPGQLIRDAVRALVSQRHMLAVRHVVLTQRGRLPRTSSGKLQRFACRQDFLAGRLTPVDSPSSDQALSSL